VNQPFFYRNHSECLVENRVKGKWAWGRGPSRETQEEAGESQGVLDPGGSCGGGEKWSGFGGILQLQPTGFPDGCNMGCVCHMSVPWCMSRISVLCVCVGCWVCAGCGMWCCMVCER